MTARPRPSTLLLPALLSGVVGGFLSAYYGALTFQVPGEDAGLFWLVSAVIIPLAALGAGLRGLWVLRPLAAVGGARTPEKAALVAAVRAVLALPDAMFFAGLAVWLVAPSSVGLLVGLLGKGGGFPDLGRLLMLSVLFGPLTSLLGYFFVSLRARQAVRALCELGLSPQELVAAAPPRRAQVRARLVIFTAICVVTPAVLTADLSSTFARHTFDEVLRTDDPALQRERAEESRREGLLQVAFLGALVFGLAVLTAWAGGTALGRPMREIAEEATRIARGNLTSPRAIPAEDEVWSVSAAFTAMQAHLSGLLTELQKAGIQIGSTTEQIVATSNRYEAGAAEQATALNETSATTEELARSARQIAENAGSVAEIAQKTLGAAQNGQLSAEAFSQSMARMKQDNRAIADSVVKLNKRVQQIGKTVEFINGVADRSDLLALNAELEGTKAGELGRGFSLVAAEMRRLAENVIESTKEIEGLIEEIREATSAAVTATETGVRATESGEALAQQVSSSLKEIVELAGQTFDAVRSISLATQQQQTGTDQLAEAMADILRVTQQSLAATKQVTAANVDLTELSTDLKSVVQRFRIAEDARG